MSISSPAGAVGRRPGAVSAATVPLAESLVPQRASETTTRSRTTANRGGCRRPGPGGAARAERNRARRSLRPALTGWRPMYIGASILRKDPLPPPLLQLRADHLGLGLHALGEQLLDVLLHGVRRLAMAVEELEVVAVLLAAVAVEPRERGLVLGGKLVGADCRKARRLTTRGDWRGRARRSRRQSRRRRPGDGCGRAFAMLAEEDVPSDQADSQSQKDDGRDAEGPGELRVHCAHLVRVLHVLLRSAVVPLQWLTFWMADP